MAGRRRARLAKAAALYIGVAALAAITAACGASRAATGNAGNTGSTGNTASGTISESGSGLLYPLAKSWAQAYQRQHPGVTVTTASPGSSAGISLASAGKVDIGASDAYLSSGDLVKNPALLNIPLAISAQTVIYNVPGLSQGSHIDLDGTALAGIYNGTITMWNDSAITGIGTNKNLNLPALKIVPVHRSDGSGDTFLFTSYLSTNDQAWDQAIGYGTTAALAAGQRRRGRKGQRQHDEHLRVDTRLHRLQRDQLPVPGTGKRQDRLRGAREQRRQLQAPDRGRDPELGEQLRVAHARPTRRCRSSTARRPPGTRSSTSNTPSSAPGSPTPRRRARSRRS